MAEWVDKTSYSQKQRERIPRTWEVKSGDVVVVVTRHLNHGPDVWCMRCDALGIGLRELRHRHIEGAKAEALGIVRRAAASIVRCVDRLP